MQDLPELEVLSVTTTVGSLPAAQFLARTLLEQHLAACVQLEAGLVSHYRWNGDLCEEPEVRLVIKTLPACAPAIQAVFSEHHPYELPQFLAVRMQASEGYARWVRGEIVATAADGSRV
jgi:periplasmic divalent cation tolerance protein